jgi:hypothetical protein
MSFRAVVDGEKSLKSNVFKFGFRDFSTFGLEMTYFSNRLLDATNFAAKDAETTEFLINSLRPLRFNIETPLTGRPYFSNSCR